MAGIPCPPEQRYATAFGGIWRRLAEGLSTAQQQRIRRETLAWFDNCIRERPLRRNRHALSLEEWVKLRAVGIGIAPWLIFLEHTLDIDLSPIIDAHPEIGRLKWLARAHHGMLNDIASFAKEDDRSDEVNSILGLHRHGLGLQEAVDAVCAAALDLADQFIRLREETLDGPLGEHGDARRYLESLGDFLAGGAQYFYEVTRYYGADYNWNGLAACEITRSHGHTTVRRLLLRFSGWGRWCGGQAGGGEAAVDQVRPELDSA
ncbi:terpene synthase family protein [Streptomyces sp. KN37]|uniref:terpene synthase family protein n=1 Tax=Streptomyces sp. KN37 TaxID=3090667 RepID=UPI002A75FE1E|nr:terpene synthase family protein [Streptomyces sp. KN37]WPO75562.1 terpene synthase family protein [Streptomyces sp. KN37]